MLFAFLLACAPTLRMPGPLTDLGRDVVVSPADPGAARTARAARAPKPPPPRPSRASPGNGEAIARAAASFLGHSSLVVKGEAYRFDCSGFAGAALAKAGIVVSGSAADLWAKADAAGSSHHHKLPTPGDLAFFDHTYDRNGNGRNDDPLSHVAVVESVDARGTITMVHLGGAGIVRLRMNLAHPHDEQVDGELVNEPLRAKSRKDPPGTRYLASELWVGFAHMADAAVADAR